MGDDRGTDRNMTSDFFSAELLEYLSGELPPGRRAEVEEYLRQHPEKAREVEAVQKTRRAFGRLRINKASPDFNAKVQERLAAKIAELRSRGSTRFRTGRERAEAARQLPSAAEMGRRGRKALSLSLLAMLILSPLALAALVGYHVFFGGSARQQREIESYRRLSEKEKRQRARRFAVTSDAAGGFSGLNFLADGTVRLLPSEGEDARCLFVYSEADWHAFKQAGWNLRGTARFPAWQEAEQSAIAATAGGGRLKLPESLKDFLPGAEGGYAALRLRDRAEIWLASELDEYLRPEVRLGPPRSQ
jgi:hypothetical protein